MNQDIPTAHELRAERERAAKFKELAQGLVHEKYEPLAIVGVGLRFPGGNADLEGFARFLRKGCSGTTPVPPDRWDHAAVARQAGGALPAAGGFIENVDRFDSGFFNISPREADFIDPQQRLILETAWEALEHAGIAPGTLRGGTGGVYVGISCADYNLLVEQLAPSQVDNYVGTGTSHSAAAGRLSYFLGLRGPSISVDTACSSSLVALHLAGQGLRHRECDIALCGGVNVIHHPRNHIMFSAAGMLAPDGECKTFDDRADGYSRSEGCAVIVLKRLSDAHRDGDSIVALVRGSAVGQTGESGGLMVPNGRSEEAVMRRALAAARLKPADVGLVEAHGTGTSLGDPIEMSAVQATFGGVDDGAGPVVVSSVKTNIGHMEAAAGVGGIVKAALQVRDAELYPHLNFQTPSRHIAWDRVPVEIPTRLRAWEGVGPRRAMVNSFGFQGTLASVLLEQPPVAEQPHGGSPGDHIFTLSAKTPGALEALTRAWRRFLAAGPDGSVADLCYTSNLCRDHHGVRLSGVVRDRTDLELLVGAGSGTAAAGFKSVFFFGAEDRPAVDAAAGLYERFPAFRESMDRCHRLFGNARTPAEAILFEVQYSLATLWRALGVVPHAVAGLGVGQVAAAVVAGALGLEDAVRMLCAPALESVLQDIHFQDPHTTLLSARSGRPTRFDELGARQYWESPPEDPEVLLAELRSIAAGGGHCFMTIGSGSSSARPGSTPLGEENNLWLTGLELRDGGAQIQRTVSRLYGCGVDICWREYHRGGAGRRVVVPSYPFERSRHWLPKSIKSDYGRPYHPLLGEQFPGEEGARQFSSRISARSPAYLGDHMVMGRVVFPAAAYVEVILALQEAVFGETGRSIDHLTIHEPLILAGDEEVELRSVLDADGRVEVSSRQGQIIRRHVSATIGLRSPAAGLAIAELKSITESDPGNASDAAAFYAELAARGMGFGPAFQTVESVFLTPEGAAVGHLEERRSGAFEVLPPPVLDGAFQTGSITQREVHLPVSIGSFVLFKKPRGRLKTVFKVTAGGREVLADVLVLEAGTPVLLLRDLRLKQMAIAQPNIFYEPRWMKRAVVGTAEAPRRILVLNVAARELEASAGRLARAGATLQFSPDAGVPTDVWWFWRGNDAQNLEGECRANFIELLNLVAMMEGGELGRGCRVWLITRGGQWLPGDKAAAAPAESYASATLWGFGPVLGNEYPGHRVTMVDLAPGGGAFDLQPLLDEMAAGESGSGEFQIAFRNGSRHVKRIVPWGPERNEDNCALAVQDPGHLSGIGLVPVDDPAPQGDEIRVQVRAAGINFKDVLNVLGLLPAPLPLGFEGAGTVIEAGPDAKFRIGEEVMVNHPGALRRRITISSAAAVAKPANLTFAQAAGAGGAYTTAYYSLHTLAQIKAGDRVLIHAAAGGVGQAALNLCRRAGATVLATASPGKWDLLRSQGVEHVMNSRTLDFAAEVMRLTQGEGVEVVINSLSGDFIAAGMSCVARHGCFVELGKLGALSIPQARALRPDVRYFNFDLSETPDAQSLTGEILGRVAGLIETGELAPLRTTSYELDEVDEAFSVLSRGANKGKLVLNFEQSGDPGVLPPTIGPDETVLVTGGLGAVGLALARKLVEMGARHLTIASRRPASGPAAIDGAQVSYQQCDVGSEDDIDRLAAVLAGGPPLAGVVHAAGVLRDARAADQTWPGITEVLRAKVYGTHLLDRMAGQFPELRFFVCNSSLAAVVGNPGQANYAAANAYMDVFMHRRRAAGEPGTSINWGPWSGEGMAGRLAPGKVAAFQSRGVGFLAPGMAADALVRLLEGGPAQTMVCDVDWHRYSSGAHAGALYRQVGGTGTAGGRKTKSENEDQTPTGAGSRSALEALILAKLAEVLRFSSPADIDPAANFAGLGVDSLVGVEFKNSLEAVLGVPLPTSMVVDHDSVPRLTTFLCEQVTSLGEDEPPALAEPTEAETSAELAALKNMVF